jgi:hypothetical protein
VYVRWLEDLRLELLARICRLSRLVAEGIGPVLRETQPAYREALTVRDRSEGRMSVEALVSRGVGARTLDRGGGVRHPRHRTRTRHCQADRLVLSEDELGGKSREPRCPSACGPPWPLPSASAAAGGAASVVGHCILLLGIFFAAGVLSRRSVPLGSPPLD